MAKLIFEDVLEKMPYVLRDQFDEYKHQTLADLAYMARHALDQYAAGDIELELRDRRQIERFMILLSK